MSAPESNNLLPVFLKLDHLTVLIVGGGAMALQRAETVMLNAPLARVTIVASEIIDPIRSIARGNERVRLIERECGPEDIMGADLVFVALVDSHESERVYRETRRLGKLVNVMDTPGLCDFYMGAVVHKGNLKLAISTNGASPTLARRLKELLTDALPDEVDEVLDNLHAIRAQLKGDLTAKIRKLDEITSVMISAEKNTHHNQSESQ